MTETLLEGTITSLYGPGDRTHRYLRESIAVLAEDKHVAIVADGARGPDGLLSIFRSMLALRGIGRATPPPTLLVTDPPFNEGDTIRVWAEETHLKNVFTWCDRSDSLEVSEA